MSKLRGNRIIKHKHAHVWLMSIDSNEYWLYVFRLLRAQRLFLFPVLKFGQIFKHCTNLSCFFYSLCG